MKIIGITSNGLNQSLSNFVVMSGKGYQADAQYFRDLVIAAGFDSKKIAAVLSKDSKVFGTWIVIRETDSFITLKTTDAFGNVSKLKVIK